MQTIDAISVTDGTPDTFAPLFVIVLITAVKDLYEDIKRHRSDREENRKTTSTLDPATVKFEKKYWYELRVGNIIKVKDINPNYVVI
jgi:phospholipid-transporting ATPase